jgi:hypothetical protein
MHNLFVPDYKNMSYLFKAIKQNTDSEIIFRGR